MSYELIAPYFDKFQKMESMLNAFARNDLTARRLAAYAETFRKAVALWDADAPSQPRRGSQQTRRLVKDCFLRILDVGLEAFIFMHALTSHMEARRRKKKEEVL